MSDKITFKNIALLALGLALIESASFFTYLHPAWMPLFFFILAAAMILLTVHKLAYGVAIALGELFIGSKGYLFAIGLDGLEISLRLALWLILISCWLAKLLLNSPGTRHSLKLFRTDRFLSFGALMFVFIAGGALNGFWQGNSFDNLFFDLNGWLYLGLILPLAAAADDKSVRPWLALVFTAALFWIAFKTFFLAFIFSHSAGELVFIVYRWVRETGVGEITRIVGGFYRVFFQSHIYFIPAFFIFLLLSWGKLSENKNIAALLKDKSFVIISASCAASLAIILLAFSRSFWAGIIAGSVIAAYFAWRLAGRNIKAGPGFILWMIIVSAISLGLVTAIVKFPYPKAIGGFTAAELYAGRAASLSEEASVSSRWQLLPAMLGKIKEAPLLGSGFGATVTYISSDPRIRQTSTDGSYTTYAFEWGWLDIWLKLGIFGLISYILFIAALLIKIWRMQASTGQISAALLPAGIFISIIVLAVVNMFTPYLNHPLGIGFLLAAWLAAGENKPLESLT